MNIKCATKCSIPFVVLSISILFGLIISTCFTYQSVFAQAKQKVILSSMFFDTERPNDWNTLIEKAMDELRQRHPDLDIQMDYRAILPYNQTHSQITKALVNQTSIDLISLDQIWVGDFAGKGLLTDLTQKAQTWDRLSDFYEANLDGSLYNDKIYGIWAWTDVRGIWYWKDLLDKANVDPDSLKTWDGFIQSIKKLDSALEPEGIQGTILFNTTYSPDLWYPYLWMLGGNIIQLKDGHPTKEVYWFPVYNSTEGIEAMEFIKQQANAGIKPVDGDLDGGFALKKYAVYLSGSWIPSRFSGNSSGNTTISDTEQKVGFIPMYPMPNKDTQTATSTMMGGWEFAVPQTSKYKDLAWELITIILEPNILAPWLADHAFLPTQRTIGEGPFAKPLNQTIPYYDEMVSMISFGRGRPNMAEYPILAEHIQQAIYEVQYGIKDPKQALDDAACKIG